MTGTATLRSDYPRMCFVCGYRYEDLADAPWSLTGDDPNYEFCVCCGAQFGYQDSTLEACRHQRQLWLAKGAPWFKPGRRPANWDLEAQLAGLPERAR